MASYSFRIKKGKYQLDLTTSDKELLVKQFELWVKHSTEYVRKKKANECKELVNTQIRAEEKITQQNIDAHLARHNQQAEEIPVDDKFVEEKNNPIPEENPSDFSQLSISILSASFVSFFPISSLFSGSPYFHTVSFTVLSDKLISLFIRVCSMAFLSYATSLSSPFCPHSSGESSTQISNENMVPFPSSLCT